MKNQLKKTYAAFRRFTLLTQLVIVTAILASVALLAADRVPSSPLVQDTDSPQKLNEKALLAISGQSNTYTYNTAAGTASVLARSGVIVSVIVGVGTGGTLGIFDVASTAVGATPQIATISLGSAGTFPLNVRVGTGCSIIQSIGCPVTIIKR